MHRQSFSARTLAKNKAALPQHSAERLGLSGTMAKKIIRGSASIVVATCLVFVFATARAQRRAQTGATSPSIPSPRAVFGFNPGDDRTIADWKQITDYFARLSRASDRVQVQTIGTSTLGRTMIAAFISAPENIRNLEKYKTIQALLADPRKVPGNSDRDRLIA